MESGQNDKNFGAKRDAGQSQNCEKEKSNFGQNQNTSTAIMFQTITNNTKIKLEVNYARFLRFNISRNFSRDFCATE